MNPNKQEINNNYNNYSNLNNNNKNSDPPINPWSNNPRKLPPKPLPKVPIVKKSSSLAPREEDLDVCITQPFIQDEVPPLPLYDHKIKQEQTSNNQKTINNFKHIKGRWEDEYGNKAKEDIIRIKTVNLLKEATLKTLEYLKSKIVNSKSIFDKASTGTVTSLYEARVQELTHQLTEYNQMPRNWANSNYFRDILRAKPRLKFEYNLLIKKYLPLPINMRIHICQVFNNTTKTKEKSELVRVGVISDMRNGFTNLKQLKQLAHELKEGRTENLFQLKHEIIHKTERQLKKGNYNVFGSAQYALNEIQDLESIHATIENRRQFMMLQALPLILEHAKKSELDKIDLLKIIDVRLLNHKANKIDSQTGWYHNEANELLDMNEIFKELSTKLLICDGQGPFIDENGDIHLPQLVKTPEGEIKKIQIFAAVVNHSVQGYTKNDGVAREVNLESYSRLVMRFPHQSHIDIAKVLMKKTTGYASALDLLDIAQQKDFKISTGCLSAKDRTGFLGAAWVVFKKMDCFSDKYKRKVIRKQLNAKYPAIKVIIDNTGTKSMKVRFFLPGVTDDFEGIALRIGSIAHQLLEMLKENVKLYLQSKEAKKENV
jgi:hypothetical protein